MAGFGREPFGHNPFGHSNFGADTVVRVFPKSTLDKDSKKELHHYLLTIQNSMNERKKVVDDMITLIDPDRVRIDILRSLGAMIGIDPDENEGEEFQRTLVRDAVQYYQVKGTDKSFEIRGKISGFDVEVVKIWNIDPVWIPYIPSDNVLEYPPGSGTVSGIWFTDLAPDSVSGVSGTVPYIGDCTYCLTSYIKVRYTLVKQPTGPVIGNLLDRVIAKIKDVIPIHVRDVFVDLTVEICSEFIPTPCFEAQEESALFMSMVDRYDIIPADCTTCDLHIPAVINGN
jgi:hypothetical protein